MARASSSRILRMIPLLISVCLFNFPTFAQYGEGGGTTASARTNTYVFLPGQSTVVQTGGIAGVHETYPIQGQFQLKVDVNDTVALFGHVDAFLLSPVSSSPPLSLGELFNMPTLVGEFLDDITASFTGKADDGSDILITVTIEDDLVYLAGETIPPPNSADFFLFSLNAVAQRKYSGGTGEPNEPYRIATAADLMLLGESPQDYDKHFVLTADIDLHPHQSSSIFNKAVIAPDTNDIDSGFQGIPFTGQFEGKGHIISNLTIEGESYLGLFGRLGSGATVTNLGLEAVDVIGTGMFVGGLVGWNEYGNIAVSYSAGTVTGNYHAGGLAGLNDHGSIAASHSTAKVIGAWDAGGLVGTNEYGSIIASYSTGKTTGSTHVGGLVGWNGHGSIAASYSTGTATGFEHVGGLVGNSGGSITASYSTGVVSGSYHIGGLVGVHGGTVTSSFWDMETSGQTTGDGGTGLTTAEMQDITTYINAGWDFVGEIANGTCDYWQISPGDYPRLHYHVGQSPVMPEGLGTIQQPYMIRDARDLGTVWFKPIAHYNLEKSIDLSGITWSMATIPWFGGTFDGNDHTISNLTIRGGGHLGLFGQLSEGGNVSNLGLEAVDINGTGNSIGGLVGLNTNGNITTSYSTGTITGHENLGGLVGWNQYGSIIDSYSTAKVTGTWEVGGLVGWIFEGNITTSYSTGMVSGDYSVGGFVGRNGFGSITAGYSTGVVTGDWLVGGLSGENSGSIATSYSTGAVTGVWSVGGLSGENSGSIATSYCSGMVKGDEDVGGLVGFNSGNIDTSYSNGTVTGNKDIGGLVGYNKWGSSITTSYSIGAVRGNMEVGGLVGKKGGEVTASFWDIETSGQAESAGGEGKTTAEMQTASTFLEAGWDFVDETANGTEDIWWIEEGQGYPRLWWEP